MPSKTKAEIKDKKVIKPAIKAVPKATKESKVVVEKKTVKTVKNSETKTSGNMSISVFGLDGAKTGTVSLSKEIFGVEPNKKLLAQAVRVYLVNQRQGTAATKTRGDVSLTTAKWYRQKGTGRARHGAKSAPIFVGGGTAHGPHPRNFELKMPQKMRRAALFAALSSKLASESILAVDTSGASGKTKEFNILFKKMNVLDPKKNNRVLFIDHEENVKRATKNIEGVEIMPSGNLNTYKVLNSKFIVFEKNAIAKMDEVFLKKGAQSE